MTNAQGSTLLETLDNLRDLSRNKPWELFLQKGLPTKDQEAFAYVQLDKLHHFSVATAELRSYSKQELPKARSPWRFVFVDGVFSQELSSLDQLPEEVIFCSIEDAKKDFSSLLQAQQMRFYQQEDTTGLDYLNEACYKEGFFLYIPPKCRLQHPIECLELTASMFYAGKMMIFVGKHAEVEFYHHRLNQGLTLCVSRHEYHLEAGSFCKVIADDLTKKQGISLHKCVARLKKQAHLSLYQLSQGGACNRTEYSVDLLEENSEALLHGFSAVKGSDQQHYFVTICHQAPHCRSHQHFKTLLKESARSSFEGKIWVDSQADKTQAYQLCNYLLLSPKTHAFAKPNLEIFADDVKASHGATIAQLCEEDLFYLKARGLQDSQAKDLLIQGFSREITQHLDEDLQKKLEDVSNQELS